MEARDFLAEYRTHCERLEELRARAFSIGGFDYGRERVTSNPSQKAPYEDYIISSVDWYEAKVRDMEELINQLEPRGRQIIQLRYRYGLQWTVIEKEVGLSERQTFAIHAKTIKKLQDLLKGKEIRK